MPQEDIVSLCVEDGQQVDTPQGSRLVQSIVAEVQSRQEQTASEYNERYIDKGPAWGEHINYRDGGQHGQTHRNSRP